MDNDGSAEVIHEGILHKLDGRLQQTNKCCHFKFYFRPGEMRIRIRGGRIMYPWYYSNVPEPDQVILKNKSMSQIDQDILYGT